MRPDPIERIVGVDRLPLPARRLGGLPSVDYADWFSADWLALPARVRATPEEWARAMFGDVPVGRARFIWRGLLGLRLSRGRSPDTVAGWRVGARGEDFIRLEAASFFLSGNLIVQTRPGGVSLTTLLRYERLLGRVVWPPLSAVHRRLIPGVLRAAAGRLQAARSVSTSVS